MLKFLKVLMRMLLEALNILNLVKMLRQSVFLYVLLALLIFNDVRLHITYVKVMSQLICENTKGFFSSGIN